MLARISGAKLRRAEPSSLWSCQYANRPFVVDGEGNRCWPTKPTRRSFGSSPSDFEAVDSHDRRLRPENSPRWRAANGESFEMEFGSQGQRPPATMVRSDPTALTPGRAAPFSRR